jgi:exosortase H (IPTLxxWG-CTERM-specific)
MALSRQQVRFVLRFALLLVLFYALTAPAAVDRAVLVPFSAALAAVSGVVLNVMQQHVTVQGTIISGGGFAVDIRNGCNGIEAMVFLCAAIGAFPAPWRQRLAGIGMATLAVQALNIVRIVSLYLIGRHWRNVFDTFHLAIWQTLIFAAAVFLFIAWTARAQQTNVSAPR